jgi:site-specific recombinase XerD
MLESFFVQKDVLLRLRSGPMGPHLPYLAVQLTQQHYARRTGCILLRTADRLGRWLAQEGVALTDATPLHLENFAASQGRRDTGRLPQMVWGVSRIAELLQPRGLLACPLPLAAGEQWLQRFDQHLLHVHGLTAKTRGNYLRYARRLIAIRFGEAAVDWSTLSADDLCSFVQTEAARLQPSSRGIPGTAISAVLRFLAMEGAVSPLLGRALPHIRRWRHASLPRHLSATQLETILAACQKPEGGSCRDRAIVLLLARLGLRAGEVRQLRLQDIDWAQGVLHVRQGKSRRERCLPLPADAGTVLVDYFQQERPTSMHREVFLSFVTPHQPLAASPAVSRIVQRVLRKAGVNAPRLGAHHLRHTTATQMVRRGTSFKDVADVLGHKSLDTTAIYAKLDEPSLQKVALPWPGGMQ